MFETVRKGKLVIQRLAYVSGPRSSLSANAELSSVANSFQIIHMSLKYPAIYIDFSLVEDHGVAWIFKKYDYEYTSTGQGRPSMS